MRKSILVGSIFIVAVLAFVISSQLSASADVASADQDISAVDSAQPDTPADTETNACDQAAPSFLAAGGSCGGATCSKGTYCCNASCGRCVPYGMSCTQESCN